jgi:type II restriction enzyme
MKFNKGEWSELYVLFNLLSTLKLYSADENLAKTKSYLDVLYVLRNDLNKEFKYLRSKGDINIIETNSNTKVFSVSKTKWDVLTKDLFNDIKAGKGNSFSVSTNVSNQLQNLLITQVKQKSKSKSDIDIYVNDPSNGVKSKKKFSIKSLIGSDPTLFNANKTTNIIYEIKDTSGRPLTKVQVAKINSITTKKKYIDRIKAIKALGFDISFSKFEDETFKLNLELIDSKFPELIAYIVLQKYQSQLKDFKNVIAHLDKVNPLGFNLSQGHNFYEYRLINFLVEASLGMTSKQVWTGLHDAIGGIIVVKDNGEVLCFHLIDFNRFKKYLINNAKLDNPSGSKMKYGDVYDEKGKSFIKLNFQVKV